MALLVYLAAPTLNMSDRAEESLDSIIAADWSTATQARVDGVLQRLPSGRLIRARTITFKTLLDLGEVPSVLVPMLEEIMNRTKDRIEIPRPKTAEDLIKMMNFFVAITKEVFAFPTIGDERTPDGKVITIKDVEFQDMFWCAAYINVPIVALAPFREEPTPNVEPVSVDAGDGGASEPTA